MIQKYYLQLQLIAVMVTDVSEICTRQLAAFYVHQTSIFCSFTAGSGCI
jgi:hypothetical protein